MEKFITGAERKEQDNFDQRDFNAEWIVGAITDEMLVDLPRSIDLLAEIDETYKQGSVPSCTATALCHAVLIQNIFDHKSNKIFVDQKDQRTSNQGKEWIANTTGDLLENALKGARKNGIKGKLADGSDFSFKLDGYMYESRKMEFQRFLKVIAYNLKNKNPMYRSMKGNSKTSSEMSKGEIKTVYKLLADLRGHAIVLGKIDFDREIVGFGNSWNWNTLNKEGNKTLSVFEISFDVFEQLLDNGIFNRRYWKIFDFKDIKPEKLFVDFAIDDDTTEEYKAVKRAKDKGYIKGVPASGGNRLYPERPITRLEMLLVLYRIFNGQ